MKMTFLPSLMVLAIVSSSPSVKALSRNGRELSEEPFLSYQPETIVTSLAAIDLDQQLMEQLLDSGDREEAIKVYKEGAHTKNYAELELNQPLHVNLRIDERVDGLTASGNPVHGRVEKAASQGDTKLRVEYDFSPIQGSYVKCIVGGHPNPTTGGCFAEAGSITVSDEVVLDYSYNALRDNKNGRSLQSLSTDAKAKMAECTEGCPYVEYEKFYKYYNEFDYANQWVMAAYNKASTNYSSTVGNANFAAFDEQSSNAAMKMGTVVMSVWMYVVKEIRTSLFHCINCNDNEENCSEERIHEWDKAVAFYVGSIAKEDGTGGNLLFSHAQKMCPLFGTCLKEGPDVGMARANAEVMKLFIGGQQEIISKSCTIAQLNAGLIIEAMTIPLVQGALHYAYNIHDTHEEDDLPEPVEARGATMAASVLPLVHACNKTDAAIIHDLMFAGRQENPHFDAVKAAFERNYKCLGVTCEAVGGLIDPLNGDYRPGAAPCGIKVETSTATEGGTTTATNTKTGSTGDNGPNVGLAVGLTIGIVAGLSIIAAVISQKGDRKEYDSGAGNMPEMA